MVQGVDEYDAIASRPPQVAGAHDKIVVMLYFAILSNSDVTRPAREHDHYATHPARSGKIKHALESSVGKRKVLYELSLSRRRSGIDGRLTVLLFVFRGDGLAKPAHHDKQTGTTQHCCWQEGTDQTPAIAEEKRKR
jgi:hypothetical protein